MAAFEDILDGCMNDPLISNMVCTLLDASPKTNTQIEKYDFNKVVYSDNSKLSL